MKNKEASPSALQSISADYSGPDRATCPEFESHPSGDREPPIPEFESHFLTQVT